jgi:hypothetical protein
MIPKANRAITKRITARISNGVQRGPDSENTGIVSPAQTPRVTA